VRPLRVTFLVDEEQGILKKRAEAFMSRLRAPIVTDLVVKERFPGDGASRTRRMVDSLMEKIPAPDVLYCVDIGLSSALAMSALRTFGKTKIVIDTGDLYGELHRESGLFGPFGNGLRQLTESLALSQASAIIVRGRLHKTYLETRGFSNVHWIPDGIESADSRPTVSSGAKKHLGVEGMFTIGVMGTAIWNSKYRFCYGWELIEVMHLLGDLPVMGIFIGDGDGLTWLKERANELDVADRIVFAGRVPHEALPEHLLAMDVCITTQSNDWIGKVRTTAKLPEYMACGRYILATDVGEASFALPPEMRVPYKGKKDPDYPARLAERIRALIAEPSLLENGQALKPLAARRFDFDVLAARLQDILVKSFR